MKAIFLAILSPLFWIRDFVTGQWINFWNWIKLAHSSSEDASSKRLYGGVIILVCLFVFIAFSAGWFPIKAWPTLYPAWFTLLFIGSGMISLAVVEKVADIITRIKIARITNDDKPPRAMKAIWSKYGKQAIIAVLLIVIGIMFANMCKRSPVTNVDTKAVLDSLKKENVSLREQDRARTDSIRAIKKAKDEKIAELDKKLGYISEKYLLLRGAEPSHDTIVKRSRFSTGRNVWKNCRSFRQSST